MGHVDADHAALWPDLPRRRGGRAIGHGQVLPLPGTVQLRVLLGDVNGDRLIDIRDMQSAVRSIR